MLIGKHVGTLLWMVVFLRLSLAIVSIVAGGDAHREQESDEIPTSGKSDNQIPSEPSKAADELKVAETRGAIDLPEFSHSADEAPEAIREVVKEGVGSRDEGVAKAGTDEGKNSDEEASVAADSDAEIELAENSTNNESGNAPQPTAGEKDEKHVGGDESATSQTGESSATVDGTNTTTTTTTDTGTATSTTTSTGTATSTGTDTSTGTGDGSKYEDEKEQTDTKPANNSDITAPAGGTEAPATDSTNMEVPPTTTELPPVVGVDLSEHDMPAFRDWKKDYEKDEKMNDKVYEAQLKEKKVAPPVVPVGELRNYASTECGAKVIGSNKEALNLPSVLNENRDDYIQQPCSASRKYLIIELCEAVIVRKIDIGNLELFSSTLENFTVSLSQKDGPSKDWQLIGTFHAKEERAIQSFQINQLDLYTAYVKIDITSYYGNEHYCPITIVRVHGISVEDDDGDDEEVALPTVTQTDVKEEEAVLDLEAPPSNVEDNENVKERDFIEGVIFPPQPDECLKCYNTFDLVPAYCVPKYYELREDKSQSNNSIGNTDMENSSQSSDVADQNVTSKSAAKSTDNGVASTGDMGVSKPCDPESGPKPSHPSLQNNTVNDDKNKISSHPSEPSDSANQSVPTASSNIEEPSPSKSKVKPSPVPIDSRAPAGNNFVLYTATPSDLSADGNQPPLEASPTTTPSPLKSGNNDVSSDNTQDDIDPLDAEHILPSAPTLAMPPTATPEVEIIEPAQPPTTAPEEEPNPEEETEPDDRAAQDPPLSAPRNPKRNIAISKLGNQVKFLEKSLKVTNRYLEEMSEKYKNQKDYLQRALNQTMRSLQNTTLKLEIMKKEYDTLKVTALRLSERLDQVELESREQKSPLSSLASAGSVGVFILVVLLISHCLGKKPTSLSREEIESILEDMPNSPVWRGLKRSDSVSANECVIGHAVIDPTSKTMKRAKSYAAFNFYPIADVGGVGNGQKGGANECQISERLETDTTQDQPGLMEDALLFSTAHTDDIEIVSPATWRSFDTPIQNIMHIKGAGTHNYNVDGKVSRPKKKRKTSRIKVSKSLYSSSESVNGTIPEQSDQSAVSSQGHSQVTDQLEGDSCKRSMKHNNSSHVGGNSHNLSGANRNSITCSQMVNGRPSGTQTSPPLTNSGSSWIIDFFRRRSTT